MPSCWNCVWLESFKRPAAGFIAKCSLLDIWFSDPAELIEGDCPHFQPIHVCAYCKYYDSESGFCTYWGEERADTDSCPMWKDAREQEARIWDREEGWA